MNRIKGDGGGCLAEIIFPMIMIVIIGLVMFTLTDTSLPFSNMASLPAAQAESQPAGSLPASFTSGVQQWTDKIIQWEQIYNVDRVIIATIMQIESCGDKDVTGQSGEASLFQVMPFHFSPGEDPYDPDTNAMRAMDYFWTIHRQTGYDVYTTFAAYNAGPSIISKSYYQWPYIAQKYYNLGRDIYDGAKSGTNVSQEVLNRCPP